MACATVSALAHPYTAQLKAGKYDEVDRATQTALTSSPPNIDAILGRIDLILSQGQESRLDEAVKLADLCVQSFAQNSQCHESVGNVLGTKAMRAGIMSSLGSLGKIRDAFKKAVELDPKNLDARFSLLEYYLQAPGFMGGGSSNANALVAQTQVVSPAAAKLMQASIDVGDKEFAKAETAVQTALPADAGDLQERQRGVMMALGTSYVQAKKSADAMRIFVEVQKRFADSAQGFYGAARTLQEQEKYAEAVAQFEKALAIKPNAGTHYRMAQALQSLDDKTRAIASFEKALAFKPELSKKQREDAQDQIKSLKG